MNLYHNTSNTDIDTLFQQSETQKSVPLSNGSWNRLNDLLEKDRQKGKSVRLRIMGIAASLLLLGAVYFGMNLSTPYHLETVEYVEGYNVYTTQDIAYLNETYARITGAYNQAIN